MNFDISIKNAIGAAVALIVIIMAVLPMIGDATEQSRQIIETNDVGVAYTMSDRDERIEVALDISEKAVRINGDVIDINKYGTYLATDTALLNFTPQNNGTHSIFTDSKIARFATSETGQFTMTLQDGEWNITWPDGTTTSGEYTFVLHATNGFGNFVQSDINKVVMNEDSEMYIFANRSNFDTTIIMPGAIAGAGSAPVYTYTPDGVKSETTATWTPVQNDDGTISIESVTVADESIIAGAFVKQYVTTQNTVSSNLMSLTPLILIGVVIVGIIATTALRDKN